MSRFSANTQSLLDEADVELCERTEGNQKWPLHTHPPSPLDQDTGLRTFTSEDGSGIGAPVQVAGTYRLRDSSWLWAWANSSLDEALTEAAKQTLAKIEANGMSEIAEPRIDNLTEEDAW